MDYRIDHMLDTGGRTLSEADRQFVTLLFRELEQFQYQAPKDRALMFHPLRGYERYLIHKVTEIFPKLTSFSIGDEKNRRTVVCFKSKRKEQQMQLGQASPERQPSRNTIKEPKTPRGLVKSKTLDSPARGRRRSSDPMGGRVKPGKYHTLDENALKKRERGLTLEGHVVNGDHDFPKSDAELRRRSGRESHAPKKKHPARRSRSQPHLNDRQGPRSRRDSYDSADNGYSDVDGYARKSHRPYSEANTPEKRRNKVYEDDRSPPRRLENDVVPRLDRTSSSESDISEKQTQPEPSDVDNNEIPPSYNRTTESKAHNKAKRNMRRIKRTNSTRSCPPIDHPKHDYVNSEAAVRREAEKLQNFYQESPVFPRKAKNSQSDAESRKSGPRGRPKSGEKKESRRKSKERKPSREYANIPTEEILRPNSYDSSPFDSFSAEVPEPVSTHTRETVAIVENAPPEPVLETDTPRRTSITSNTESLPNHVDIALKMMPISSEIPLAAAEALAISTREKSDKDCQTDLQGSLVDAMMSTYQAHLDAFGQLAPPGKPSQPGSAFPPSSLLTSGNSTPSLSSPASSYERLGEYMYKAMLNFQNMMIGSQNGPTPFPGPPAVYAPMPQAAQPVYVPWMAPYFTDPNGTRPGTIPYSSQNSTNGDACCHMHHHVHHPNGPLNKMPPRSHGSLKDLRKDSHRPTSNDHWHGHRYSDRTPSSAEHSLSAHPSRSSKAADGFESDVSSEVTNPEVTVAEGGDGLMVYVRNRSTSSTGGASIGGSASSLQGPGGDNAARASPLGHDSDNIFRKPPNSIAGEDLKRSSSSKRSTPKNSPKKSRKSSKSKKSNEKPPMLAGNDDVNGPGVASEEVILSLSNAPLATMEDEDDEIEGSASGSYTSSHSTHHEDADTESASKSLVGEDLSPLVCFDDNLEIACQDGSAED